ncbi:MAG: glycosyltransferase [Planctomycetota bacterium]
MADPPASSETLEHPPVTVLMPAYNQENFIEDAIVSVQRQDYGGPITILIWNDGSTDRTLEIVNRMMLADPRIQVRSAENQGRPLARQCLLEAAETELVAWLDPDDFASPVWLREQVARLQSDPEIVACGGQAYSMLADRDPVAPIARPLEHDEIHGIHLEGGVAINQTGVLTRRSSLVTAGGYRERYTVGEDFDLWLRVAEHGKLANLPTCHTFYRLHEASANWSAGSDERGLWYEILNQARQRHGLPLREVPTPIPPRRDDWNRRVFWINLAAKRGNARSCLKLVAAALRRHPGSLLLWLFGIVAVFDSIRFLGNCHPRFLPGRDLNASSIPVFSFYQLARKINHLRRRVVKLRGTLGVQDDSQAV